ncbi:TetR/AcrR family transcriptional regulator [Streptomyces olivaceoviridis]|uniref:TetR/AcrR family transcriptional regulator n=1 Tax=Streptomyces olivaceoviridis TaxID=1921 RepID=UPI0036F90383
MAERDKPGRRRRLSRPVVLDAAVALVDREGLAALTVRRLAADLGVEPMTLYRYTDGKEGLLDGLVEVFFAEVNGRLRTSVERARADAAGEPRWRTELRRIARAFAGVVHAHPEVLPVVAVRPLAVPVARRPEPWLQLTWTTPRNRPPCCASACTDCPSSTIRGCVPWSRTSPTTYRVHQSPLDLWPAQGQSEHVE